MAARCEHIKCPACGSQRQPEAYSINARGNYDPNLTDAYEAMLCTRIIGGRGRCEWIREDLPLNLALSLRARLRAVLGDLERQLQEGGVQLDEGS
jgi:hypothetical protein